MPKTYKRCVKKVKAKGHSKSGAHAMCTAADAGGIKAYRKKEAKRKGKRK